MVRPCTGNFLYTGGCVTKNYCYSWDLIFVGIGLSLCKKLYAQGAFIYALDVSQEALDKLVQECPKIVPLCVNLLDWNATRKTVESIPGTDTITQL